MTKSPDAFRTISEVADWLGIQAHVLRFWESKFVQVKPVKRAGGRRYYRPSDMLLLGGIKKLLHDDGLTIKGVQRMLRENGVSHVSELSQSLDENARPVDGSADATDDDVVVSFANARGRAPLSDDAEQFDMDLGEPAPEPTQDEAAEAFEDTQAVSLDEAIEATSHQEHHEAPDDLEEESEHPAPDLPAFDDVKENVETSEPVEEPEEVEAQSEDQPDQTEEGEPIADVALIPVVDAPDPLADDQLDYTAGPITALAKLGELSPDLHADLTVIAAELRELQTRTENVVAE